MTFQDVREILESFNWVVNPNISVRVRIGNQLYGIRDIDTVIDMDTNKPNLVIHVDDK